MIEVTHLNKEQFQALLSLQNQIKKKDHYTAPIYTHIIRVPRPYPCNILIYQGQDLIGFASRFLFHEGQVEFSLMIHPKFRTPFMAKKLLVPLLKYVPQPYKNKVIIATAHGHKPLIKSDAPWEYLYSSHRLQWQGTAKKPESMAGIEIIKAQSKDFLAFKKIITSCFPNSTEMLPEIYESLMENTQTQIYLLQKGDEYIGAIQINHENKSYRISDVAILPTHQQCGLGNYLIMNILHQLQIKQQPIFLDVESTNTFVLAWYKRIGMKEINISDFWKISFQDIF